MTADRIIYDLDADGFETERVDEIVLSGATLHLEMSSHTTGWMSIWTGYRTDDGRDEEHRFVLRADPVTRAVRRERLKDGQDRLVDHLGCLLPWRWHPKHPRWVGWAIPVHRRPAAAVRDWWTARRYAGVALTVMDES